MLHPPLEAADTYLTRTGTSPELHATLMLLLQLPLETADTILTLMGYGASFLLVSSQHLLRRVWCNDLKNQRGVVVIRWLVGFGTEAKTQSGGCINGANGG